MSEEATPRELIEGFHARYSGVLYHKCLRILGDPGEAEDALQEVFVVAFRRIETLDRENPALPWLYTITTNVCLKALRTRRRRHLVLVEDTEELQSERPATQEQSFQVRQILERIVDGLDERSREILVSHFVDGMSQDEIAESMGISRRAVVKRLKQVRVRYGYLFEEGVSCD